MVRENYRQALQHYEQALQLRPNWPKAARRYRFGAEALEPQKKTAPVPVPEKRRSINPELMVDPSEHGSFLTHVHQAAIESEESGRMLNQILEREVEPTIKELSTALMYPHGPRRTGRMRGKIRGRSGADAFHLPADAEPHGPPQETGAAVSAEVEKM